jgi:hypothetical protein
MRRLALSVAFLCAIDATPARGAHCPQGELWRVHLRTCVGLNTALARPFEPVLARGHRRGARNAPATIPDAPRGDPPDPADAIDAALLIPLLEAAAARWRASVAPDVQSYPDPPESGPWPPLSPCCDE